MSPRTLFDKVWDAHVVHDGSDGDSGGDAKPTVLYIDLHLIHEVTSPQAFSGLAARGIGVRRPDLTLATMDHSTPTLPGGMESVDTSARVQLERLRDNCAQHGIELFALGDPRNGIVHVVGPEAGRTQPGMTIVCGDSHTSTHGAFGALAHGIGTSEVEHVFATQCLLQRRPKTLEIRLEGAMPEDVTAKDVILAIIAEIGTGGGTGHVIEYRGAAIEAMSMEERMTVCNMSIEAGARAGMIAPDETTFAYLKGRSGAPAGEAWDAAVERWKALPTDPGATFHKSVTIDVSALRPMVTYGTHPGMGLPIDAPLPLPDDIPDIGDRKAFQKALAYMGLQPGEPLAGTVIDAVFVGSCTNSRLSDLRAAAEVLQGRRVADGVRMLVVPGSQDVKAKAEAEGLDHIFLNAGAQWREPGCSMCIAMNGDQLAPGEYAVSTSNRNFEGRQGKGGRTFLASPATAAASAVAGCVAEARSLPERPLMQRAEV